MDHSNNKKLKSSAIGGMFWKLAERICAQLVSLAVSIVLARMLLPEDYSVVSIVMIFFAFCNIFISDGMNAALIQKKEVSTEDYASVLCINLVMALLLYLLIFVSAPLIARLYDKPQLVPIFRVMGLTFFVNAYKSVLSAYTSSNLQFRRFFLSTIIGTACSAVVGIAMAANGFGAWALVAQEMTNTVMDTLILTWTTKMIIAPAFSPERIKSLFAYGWKIMFSAFVSVLYDQISPLIVGLRFSDADLAFYNKGKSFPGLLNSTISDTLSSVLFPVMAKVQDQKEDILNMTRRYVKTSSYVVFPLMIGLMAVAETFTRVLLTDKWLSIIPYIRIFAFSYMFNLVQVGNLQAIRAIGRSDIILILEIIKKSLYFCVIVLFVFYSGSPEVFAASNIICTVLALVINTYPNRKLLGYSYRDLLRDLIPNLGISIVMGLLVVAVGRMTAPGIMILLVQVGFGVVAYVVLSAFTKNENFTYLLNFILQLVKGR